jgi:hypothetical protein
VSSTQSHLLHWKNDMTLHAPRAVCPQATQA